MVREVELGLNPAPGLPSTHAPPRPAPPPCLCPPPDTQRGGQRSFQTRGGKEKGLAWLGRVKPGVQKVLSVTGTVWVVSPSSEGSQIMELQR